MTSAPETQSVSAQIPLDLARRMDRAMEHLHRPRSWVVQQALTAWLSNEEVSEKPASRAEADANFARPADYQWVVDWTDSLTEGPLRFHNA